MRHQVRAAPCRPRAAFTYVKGTHTANNLRKGDTMAIFDERESAFENKFAHDEEMQFKADARANKLLGLWAAALLGKSGDAAEAYAQEVIKSDFEEAGHEDVFRKLSADLGARTDEATLRAKMAEARIEAKAQIMTELG